MLTETAAPIVEQDPAPSPTIEPAQADPGDENDFVLPAMGAPFVSPEDESAEGVVAQMAQELRRLRFQIAGLARGLAFRELDGRLLRAEIEARLRPGTTKTDAERGAKEAPAYIAYCRATAQMERRKAEAEATAECARFLIQARIAVMTAEVL